MLWGLCVWGFFVLQDAVIGIRLDNIYWNSSSPMFRIDNTDHVIDVNKHNAPYDYDQVNLVCPVYSQGTRADDTEKYIIYNVSKEEYDTCTITSPNPRIIAICDKPYRYMFFTITFRPFTPQPGGLEFRPGQDYYFISTSSKDNLFSRLGGHCLTHNMRAVFKVCCNPNEVVPTLPPPRKPSWSSTRSPHRPIVRPTEARYPHWWTTANPNIGMRLPEVKVITVNTAPVSSATSTSDRGAASGFWSRDKPKKKPENREKIPNETGEKTQELVHSGSDSRQLHPVILITAFLLHTVTRIR